VKPKGSLETSNNWKLVLGLESMFNWYWCATALFACYLRRIRYSRGDRVSCERMTMVSVLKLALKNVTHKTRSLAIAFLISWGLMYLTPITACMKWFPG